MERNYRLLESGFLVLLEDDSGGAILLEAQPAVWTEQPKATGDWQEAEE